ncbi:GIY-YIG nuclease family protein [Phenylobacterium sp.]|uniref:GIY-YIG nuclease family protein n=1 Tax=Phenylobacterium sp. TaxID=1871053 RepID=UPI003D26C2F9
MVGEDAFIAVYILASGRNGTLYTGVTSTLVARVRRHKHGTFEGFSKTYGGKTLVWYQTHAVMLEAIRREKQIKRWRRDWKLGADRGPEPRLAGSFRRRVRGSRGTAVVAATTLAASPVVRLGPGSPRSHERSAGDDDLGVQGVDVR